MEPLIYNDASIQATIFYVFFCRNKNQFTRYIVGAILTQVQKMKAILIIAALIGAGAVQAEAARKDISVWDPSGAEKEACLQAQRAHGRWKDPASLRIEDGGLATLDNAGRITVLVYLNGKTPMGGYAGKELNACYKDKNSDWVAGWPKN